jgi:hypothetical protein
LQVSDDESWRSVGNRYGAQLGSLEAILRTRSYFLIHYSGDPAFRTASQIARNLFQYFGADSELLDADKTTSHTGNNIRVLYGPSVALADIGQFPLQIETHGLSVVDAVGLKTVYPFEAGQGALFLRPLPAERLEMVVWGFDVAGLHQASRLVPMLTGVGQPDFVITSKQCSWKGAAGVLAMGFFDHGWNVSQASYIT